MGKVIILGIDGLPSSVLDRYAKTGVFKNIKKVINQGCYAPLRSVHPPITGPAWMSFFSGQDPQNHGIYDFLMPYKTLGNHQPAIKQFNNNPTLFDIIDENDLKAVFVNAPFSSMLGNHKNITVVGDMLATQEFFFSPKEKLRPYKQLQSYRMCPEAENVIKSNGAYIQDIRDVEAKRFDLAQALFLGEEYDLFFVLFSGSDWGQHESYNAIFHEKPHKIHELFKDIDRYVGWFVENITPEDTLIILSDHGFRKLDGAFAINTWLSSQGFLKTIDEKVEGENKVTYFRGKVTSRDAKKKKIRIPPSVFKIILKNKVLTEWSFKAREFLRGFGLVVEKDFGYIDYENSLAVSPSSESFGIYLNRKNVFENGFLDEEESNKLKYDIIAKLTHLKDNHGRLVMSWVKQNEGETGPDILFYPENYQTVSRLVPALFVEKDFAGHADTGIIICYGNNVKHSNSTSSYNINDLLPTILPLLNCKIPSGLVGKSITDFFYDLKLDYKKYRKSKIDADNIDLLDDEGSTDEIKKRLSALGYLQ